MKTSMVGRRNGRLVVLNRTVNKEYIVRCDCGVEKVIDARNFYRTASCGCLFDEVAGKAATTHGFTKGSTQGERRPPEYEAWGNMIQRCTNSKRAEFENYGGRGITVCERWAAFENFYSDMGPRPSSRHSIDRIDNDGNYEPGNVRWATKSEQSRNQRRSRIVTVEGKKTHISDVAERYGMPNKTTYMRVVGLGWSIEDAVVIPVAKKQKLNVEPGTRFGFLVVVKDIGRRLSSNHTWYLCKCDCGSERMEKGTYLVGGRTVKCCKGCTAYDQARDAAENAPGQLLEDLVKRK